MDLRRISTLSLLASLVAAAAPSGAAADQQAPTQHSPAFEKYSDVPDGVDERQTSSVALHWSPMAQANHYLLKVSRDPNEVDVLYTIDTAGLSHDTPELAPGAYYFSVMGLEGNRRVGQKPSEPFVVGKPVALNGRQERLPAPTIVGPKHMDLYPTFGYVRVAWKPVDGARGYRFRLWNDDKVRENTRWKRDTPPRWITEVKQPWIEVHDAPYTSYMYLETGTYRWDVAAIDKDGGYIGETALGYFRTSRQWFLKPNEIFLHAGYIFAPNALYSTDSSITGQKANFNSTSHRLDADLDWWFWRQWGVNVAGGFQSLAAHSPSVKAADTLLFIHTNADLLFRTYLSTVPWGWTLTLSAGFGMQEFPQIDQFASNIHVVRPKILGANLGVRVNKHFFKPWELEWRFHSLIPAYTGTVPGGALTSTTLIAETGLKAIFNWSYHFATELGIGGQFMQARYAPQPFLMHSNVLIEDINVMFGFRFNYYPPPDNTNYYPEHEGAYYPSERPAGYYRSEEKTYNNDSYHKDSSSWQRWRPR